MNLKMLKAKLHLANVTHAELQYDGSCAIDQDLLDQVGLREFEAIDVYNVNNGERFSTYIILGERGSGMISMNGAAARKVQVGDRVIIAAYGQYSEAEAEKHIPQLLYFDGDNKIARTNQGIPIQAV
jgi:aspartate 1-decarboxylase